MLGRGITWHEAFFKGIGRASLLGKNEKKSQSLSRICFKNFAKRLLFLFEHGKNSRVKMLRLGAAIAVDNDIHCRRVIECGFVGALASKGVVNIADIHEA